MGKKEKSKGNQSAGGGPTGPQKCGAKACKHDAARFGFCAEHYDHFKFGLINKEGQRVPDYEKKLDHFVAYQEKLATQKVA